MRFVNNLNVNYKEFYCLYMFNDFNIQNTIIPTITNTSSLYSLFNPINKLINTQTRYLAVFHTHKISDDINLLTSLKTKKNI